MCKVRIINTRGLELGIGFHIFIIRDSDVAELGCPSFPFVADLTVSLASTGWTRKFPNTRLGLLVIESRAILSQ